MPTITLTPDAGADDGFWREYDSSFVNNFSYIGAGDVGDGSSKYNAFIRFIDNLAELPAGATIDSAVITMEAHATLSGTTCRLLIRAVDEDAPAAPVSYADAEGRTRTTTSVAWTPAAATDGVTQDTPNFASVVQEWADRAGRAAGDPVLIYLEDNGSDAAAHRQWRSQNGGPAPVLTIEFTEGGGAPAAHHLAGTSTGGSTSSGALTVTSPPAPEPEVADRPTWTVELDTNDDGSFDTSLTADGIEADWEVGFSQAYQNISYAARANLVLKNTDGAYSPEHAAALAGFQRNRRVRILADYDGPNTPHGLYSRDVSAMGTVPDVAGTDTSPHFNGTSDYIDLLANGDLADRFNGNAGTVMLWLKMDSGAWADGEYRYAFRLIDNNNEDVIHAAKTTTANEFSVERYVGIKSTNHIWYPGATHGTNWWHLAVTWSERGNYTRVYDSGALIDEDEIVASWLRPVGHFEIGRHKDFAQYWDGAIGHVALWGEPLHGDLVAVLAGELINPRERILSTKPHYLLGYWPLGETSGVEATDASTRRTMFMGRIRSVRPAPGIYASRKTQVEVSGFLDDAQHADRLKVELRTDTNAGECILAVVDAAGVYPPPHDGVNTESWASVRPTQATYAFALDDVRPTDTLYDVIRRLAVSEGWPARVYETRAGMLRVIDRHFLVGATESKATIDGVMRDMQYAHGETVYNRVQVSYHPRALETDDAPYTLGVVTSTVRINPGETREIRIRYDDGSGNRIATTDPIEPVAGTHYHINTESDESGDWVDTDPDWTLTATHYAGESVWSITNASDVPGYLTAYSYQAGSNRLVDFGEQIVEVEDAASQAAYGVHPLGVVASYLNTREADGLARALLEAHLAPRGEAQTVTLKPYRSHELLETVLRLSADNLDRITVTETQTGHDGDHFIVGEHHWLRRAGKDYEVQWTLEPAGLFDTVGVYGTGARSLLDGVNVLGY